MRKIDLAAAISSAIFVACLGVAAYWEPSIRILHIFESLPYIAAAILCLRRLKLGYAIGVVSGAFWLWTAGFLTTFILNGFERLVMLVNTGSVDRLDILIAIPAAIGTGGLVIFSSIAYAGHPRKSRNDFLLFLTALLIVPAFFILIFAAFAPQYLGMFQQLLSRRKP